VDEGCYYRKILQVFRRDLLLDSHAKISKNRAFSLHIRRIWLRELAYKQINTCNHQRQKENRKVPDGNTRYCKDEECQDV